MKGQTGNKLLWKK